MIEKFYKHCTIINAENSSPELVGAYSVREILKEGLGQLRVPFYDLIEPGGLIMMPVAYDVSDNKLKRYDPVTFSFIEITGLTGGSSLLTYRTTAVTGDYLITDNLLEVTAPATITMNITPVVGVKYDIANTSVGVVTIDGGAYNIAGDPTHDIPSGESRTLFFNGAQYIII